MTREVVLLAAKNHSMFIVDICRDAGVPVHGFLDDTLPIGHKVMDRPGLGGFSMMEDASFRDNFDFFVAMGTPMDRLKWGQKLIDVGATVRNIVHPSCVVTQNLSIGLGALLCPFTVVHADAFIGNFVVVDNHSTVAHHVVLADGVNLSPGVRAMGSVSVGETTFIGAGAVLVPRISIGARSIVGAGAVVTKDIPSDVKVVGNPAKVIDTN